MGTWFYFSSKEGDWRRALTFLMTDCVCVFNWVFYNYLFIFVCMCVLPGSRSVWQGLSLSIRSFLCPLKTKIFLYLALFLLILFWSNWFIVHRFIILFFSYIVCHFLPYYWSFLLPTLRITVCYSFRWLFDFSNHLDKLRMQMSQ